LREEWVIIAAHRQDRPWSGKRVAGGPGELPEYDPDCYLCPGNTRVMGRSNPRYEQIFCFDNDHPCVGDDAPTDLDAAPGMYSNRPARGIARVLCYTPRHDLSLSRLGDEEVEKVIKAWADQYDDLGQRDRISHVLIFENRGDVVGTSNPHPHCQIYATNFVFKTIETEARVCSRHLEKTGRVLFQSIIASEKEDGRRIICENSTAIAFVPYFARYAYEVYVAPKAAHESAASLCAAERIDLARVLKTVLVKLDNLWHMPHPYVMPLHQAPTAGRHEGFHFHIEIHPPLRKPNLLKYLAGPEIGGGNFLSDTSPEEKAAEIRGMPDVHHAHVEEGK